MLPIVNFTPFVAGLALFTDQHGAEKVSIAIKGTFIIPPRDGEVQVADEQLAVLHANKYYGEPGKSSIKYPADVILGKVNTDVGLIGSVHSPDGRPVKKLRTFLRVGQLQKQIVVTGDRRWKKRTFLPGFYMTKPVAFVKMPLTYERAFGGVDKSHKNKKKHGWDERNPVGTGYRLKENVVDNHRLPNLETPNLLISHWKDKPPVACYGFSDGHWQQRSKFGGTYDDTWLKDQFPLLAKDFDLRFFDAASPDLIAKGFLKGGESVKVINVSKKGVLAFNLPKLEIGLTFRLGETSEYQKANLWTVAFEPDEDRFYMVWGGTFCAGKQPSRVKYVMMEIEGKTNPASLEMWKVNRGKKRNSLRAD